MSCEEFTGGSKVCKLCNKGIEKGDRVVRLAPLLAKRKLLMQMVHVLNREVNSMKNSFNTVEGIIGNIPPHFEAETPGEKLQLDTIYALHRQVNSMKAPFTSVAGIVESFGDSDHLGIHHGQHSHAEN